jgi:hypothetical protein
MEAVIDTLGGIGASEAFKTVPVKGGFTVAAENNVRLHAAGCMYGTSFSSAVKFTALGFDKRSVTTDTHSDISGINKRLVKPESDQIDHEALRALVVKMSGIKADIRTSWIDQVDSVPPVDSHVAFILNMLISWYKALMYRTSANEDRREGDANTPPVMVVRQYNYSDSHLTVSKGEGEGEVQDVDISLRPPNDLDPEGDDAPDQFAFTYAAPAKTDVLLLPHISKQAYTFYVTHAGGRNKTSALNFECKLPGVEMSKLAVRNTTPGSSILYAPIEEMDWTDDGSMWYWLCEYVNVNRVENHFAVAFEILGSLCYRPVADTAEGTLYRESDTLVYVPRPSFYRARFPGLLDGEGFSIPHDSRDLVLKASGKAHQQMQLAGVINYVAHIGLVACAAEGLAITDDPKQATGMSASINHWMWKVKESRVGAVSAVLGRDIFTVLPPETGVVYPVMEVLEAARFPFAVRSTDESDVSGFDYIEGAGLKFNNLYFPASPALLYGKCSDQLMWLSTCRPMHEFTFRDGRDTILDLDTAYRLANMYRLSGCDVVLQDVQRGTEVRPFSSLDAIHLAPPSMEFKARLNTTYIFEREEVRNKDRSRVIPGFGVLADSGEAKLFYNTTSYRTEVPGRRGRRITTTYRKERELRRVTVRISQGTAVKAEVVKQRIPVSAEVVQGFHAETTAHPDQPQEINPILLED